MENIGNIDSKYRFVILAAKRAKQLLRGVKPKIKAKSKNLIRIAQTEVRSGLIDFEILPTPMDETASREDRAFVDDELAVGVTESDDGSSKTEDESPEEENEEEEGEEEENEEEESDEDDSEDSEENLKDE